MFRQFASLDLAPPNTFSDIPHVLSNLHDKLVSQQLDSAPGKGSTKSKGAFFDAVLCI